MLSRSNSPRTTPSILIRGAGRPRGPAVGRADPHCSVWSDGPWPSFPYRSIEVTLGDGSFFRLCSDSVARHAAALLSAGHERASEKAHLQQQIVPAVCDKPELLLEFAAQLPWSAVRSLAREARWKNSPVGLQGVYRRGAAMVLSTGMA